MPLDQTSPTSEQLQGLSPLAVPSISPSYFQATSNSNEIVVICNQMVPMVDAAGQLSEIGRLSPMMLLRLSPQAAKDLILTISENVRQLEQEFGPITTAYTKIQQGKSNA